MTLPDLTVGICTYKRPWYALQCIMGFKQRMRYDGHVKFFLADGGSSEEDLKYYGMVLNGLDWSYNVTDNLSSMVNSIARNAGDLFVVCVDDFILVRNFDITPDVKYLLSDPEVGQIRFGRLAHWGSGDGKPETFAELMNCGGLHWWKLDKERTKDNYMCSIGIHLYHRRFWDAYGDIPPCDPKVPGQAELLGSERFRLKAGPTVAVPLRFPEDSAELREYFWHIGVWRTDDYASTAGTRF